MTRAATPSSDGNDTRDAQLPSPGSAVRGAAAPAQVRETPATAQEAPAPARDDFAALAARENFPVALRALPRTHRRRLLAVYRFARLVDDIGDEPPHGGPGRRLRALDAVEQDLDRAFSGSAAPRLPIVGEVARVAAECGIPATPLRMLIEANRQDQAVSRYATFDDLLGYCRLSANPVGRMVLHVFGAATPERERLSDLVCTALQLAEHWQDVAEDFGRGRVYLPQHDLAAFGCTEHDLAVAAAARTAAAAPGRLRELMRFETERAATLLRDGAALTGTLRGWARLAVAGYVAGGRATLAAIERAGARRAGTGEAGTGEAGTGEAGTGEAGTGRAGAGEAGTGRAGAGKAYAGKTGATSAGAAASGGLAGYDVFGATPRPGRAATVAGLLHAYLSGR